jgi:hypothetical protein
MSPSTVRWLATESGEFAIIGFSVDIELFADAQTPPPDMFTVNNDPLNISIY